MESPFLLVQERPTYGQKEAFGFKIYYPLGVPKLEPFEKDLCNLVNLIKFRTNMNSFKGN